MKGTNCKDTYCYRNHLKGSLFLKEKIEEKDII